ncbi:MAG: hypothetical protein Q9N34_03715 [Aquificota bacterium]|nr:hypothetical protein [Aquificota bacterium]
MCPGKVNLLRKLGYNPRTRFKDLPERVKKILLYGSDQEIEF